MDPAAIIGIDVSKRSLRHRGATAEDSPVFRKSPSRRRSPSFFPEAPSCLQVWRPAAVPVTGAAVIATGHDCRPVPPACVKPFAGRLQADRNDAAAIARLHGAGPCASWR